MSWEQYLASEVLTPLGMDRTGFFNSFDGTNSSSEVTRQAVWGGGTSTAAIEANAVVTHAAGEAVPPQTRALGWTNPAGGLASCPRDMASFMKWALSASTTHFPSGGPMGAGGVNAWMRASYDQPDGLSGYGAGGHERFYVNGTWAVCKSGVAVGAAAQLALVPAFGLGVAAHAADSASEEPPELVAELMHALIPPLRRLLAQLECAQSQIPDEAVQLLTAGPWGSAARGTVLTAQLAASVGRCTLEAAMPTIFGVPSMGVFTLRTAHGVQASMIDLAQSIPAAPSVTRVVWTFRYMANATKLREILAGAESISCQRLTALGVPGLGFLLDTSAGMRLWLPGDDGNTLHTLLTGSEPSPSATSPPASPPPPPPTAAEADRVAGVPGWSGPLPSPHYSGYVPVRGGSRQLHYYLQEAEEAAAEKPLILWLQGGPTASSLLGAFVEVGQLVFTHDSYQSGRSVPRLFRNPYSYTAHANMLFLEQPVATGFSRCVDPTSPCESSDNSTAQESHEFMVGFFARFPEYTTRPFYIMGESYAGMFTTWLMEEIWRQNVIPVRGVSLGNACFGTAAGTNCGTIPKYSSPAQTVPVLAPAPYLHLTCTLPAPYLHRCTFLTVACALCVDWYRYSGLQDYPAFTWWSQTQYYADRYLISREMQQTTNVACSASDPRAVWTDPLPAACATAFQTMEASRGTIYLNYVTEACPVASSSSYAAVQPNGVLQQWCGAQGALLAWMAMPAVARALHVEAPMCVPLRLACRPYNVQPIDNGPIYRRMANTPGFKLTIYNGLNDANVPVNGQLGWINQTTETIQTDWVPWHDDESNMTAGNVRTYATAAGTTFLFVTLRGAGHEAPETKPAQAVSLLRQFALRT